MMYIVLTFLFLALFAYLLFGGADFGIGILELFSGKENKTRLKKVAYSVIGPVWEANHIWLILLLVILWVCFPANYYVITTQLHIPLTLLLIGIIGRGVAFIFRHYDAYIDNSQKTYDAIFRLSSVFTPFLIGVNAGALLSGEIIHPDHTAGLGFKELYIDSWFNTFSLTVGIFNVALSAFTSSILLIGQTSIDDRSYFLKKARLANLFVIFAGLLVFAEAFIRDRKIASYLFDDVISLVIIITVSILLYPLWKFINHRSKNISRAILAIQVLLILAAWMHTAFPYFIITKQQELSLLTDLPETSVFNTMGYSLLGASVFVLPGLYHLFRQFGLISVESKTK